MVTYRTALAGAFMVLAVLTAGSCQQLNEALNDRDLECIEVPDDICAKLADHIVDRWWPPALIAEHGPIVRVVVQPIDCVDFEQRGPGGSAVLVSLGKHRTPARWLRPHSGRRAVLPEHGRHCL